ncbi:MAG: glycoside hydrolase family 28 protein [candidate division KSB1 bacterium]|nr:glycoside hydrolase family 28 protein [candidate division KSB1 bacterium]
MQRIQAKPIIWVGLLFFCMSVSGVFARSGYYNVLDYGAVPDGETLCSRAIQNAVDDCAESGGGTVVIPPGDYLSRPIFLKSHINFKIETGATLIADTTIDAYPAIDGRAGGIERKVYASLLTGHHLDHISITGGGTLEGQGQPWWNAHRKTKMLRRQAGITEREPENPQGSPLKWPRPKMVNLYHCNHVLIRDVTITNSPSWTVHPVYCDNVTIDNISIIQPYESPNTDGINPESCSNVRIVNCFVDCGDDCITLKSGYNQDGRRVNEPCENIVISNCVLAHGRSAVGIGSETSGGIWNVTINNCVFQNTYRGLRIKTARGRGNVVRDIRAANIIMDNVETAISLDMYYDGNDEQYTVKPVDETTPFLKNISYSHITGTDIKYAAKITGLPEAPIENLQFIDIDLQAETGIQARFLDNVDFHNIEIQAQKGSAFAISHASIVDLDEITTKTPVPGEPVIALENVKDVQVRNCTAVKGTGIFLELRGNKNQKISLIDNLLEKAQIPFRAKDGSSVVIQKY